MKIAITGHSEGIGKCFAEILTQHGHEIVGLSRRTGHNIRSLNKVIGPIVECDWFINNAQVGFAQTELLYKVWHQWHNTNKIIWNISSIMATHSSSSFDMEEYRLQKQTLDQAHYNLSQRSKCRLVLIRPGKVDTQNEGGAPVDVWCNAVLNTWNICEKNNLRLQEISIGNGS